MNTEDEWFSINEKETLPEIQRFVPSQIELIEKKLENTEHTTSSWFL